MKGGMHYKYKKKGKCILIHWCESYMNMHAYLRYQFWKLTQSRNSITLSSIAYSAYTHVVVQHVFSFKYDYGMAYLVVKQCKPVQCVACSWYNCLQCITTSKEVNIQAQARPSLRYLGKRYDQLPYSREQKHVSLSNTPFY